MNDRKQIVVVGGGSSGWMAAAYLDAVLNRRDRTVDICLIESPDVPRIGVGEATIPSIHHILAAIGIDELEFLNRVDGTFKHAIKYVNWLDGKGESYYHAFGRQRGKPLDSTTRDWLRSDRSLPFSATISAQPALCELGIGAKPLGGGAGAPEFTYAYHMNAQKFADYLTEIATARGVEHVLDHVTAVQQTEDGKIASLSTRGGRTIAGDLFVDCTGFAALLIEKQLKVPWIDCSPWLMSNAALTIQVPYEASYPGRVRPNTLATAVSSGWIWEIPLQNRRAWGYVHAGDFISREAAETELRQFVGPLADDFEARYVPFKVGYRAKAWVKNCVAIGLSGGFIEPLESTGLYLSDLATVMLAEHFPHHGQMETLAFRYNRIIANRFHEILDFINLHYCLTRREDTPFWREVRQPERVTDRLRSKLEFWRSKPPGLADFEDQWLPGQADAALPSGGLPGDHRGPVETGGVFGLSSYEAILYGMDFLREECDQWFGARRPATEVPAAILNRIVQARQCLPTQDLWLQQACGMPNFEVR